VPFYAAVETIDGGKATLAELRRAGMDFASLPVEGHQY
jgi:hypothetical protein